MARPKEPRRLRVGKRFHKAVQAEWATAPANGCREKTMRRLDGSAGRMDVYVADDGCGEVAILEIKRSNWDRMTMPALKRNVSRYIRQVWSYIEPELEAGRNVSPGIHFAKLPRRNGRLELIEQLFGEMGIPCVWHDETTAQRRKRG